MKRILLVASALAMFAGATAANAFDQQSTEEQMTYALSHGITAGGGAGGGVVTAYALSPGVAAGAGAGGGGRLIAQPRRLPRRPVR